MLTKRQLEDAARCTIIDCEDCSVYCVNTIEVTRRAARTALAYREILERLEWQSFTGEHCPICGGAKPDALGGGHTPTCELATLLKGSADKETRDTIRLIETRAGYNVCENCGESFKCEPQENKYNFIKYCPNCGVKFDEYATDTKEVEHAAICCEGCPCANYCGGAIIEACMDEWKRHK
jgi:hypothetical protein